MHNYSHLINTKEILYEDVISTHIVQKNKIGNNKKSLRSENVLVNTSEILYSDMFK